MTPAKIQRFEILHLLGRGGMGVVYAARDPDLDRRVALKQILPGQDLSDLAQRRMLREAQSLAKISHPNIVQIFEVGSWDGTIYIAMEHLAGQALHVWLRATRETRIWQQTVQVFVQAALGLFAVHRGGLVHRDFKPANVFLTTAGQVRLLDFGLVRPHGGDVAETTKPTGAATGDLTQTGALVGTPRYMAPEALAGCATDPRSDQFSFCVALYEALYNQRPYPGELPDEMLAAIQRGRVEPPPPGSKVPVKLYHALRRGLQPKPDERWRDMMALVEALQSPRQGPSLLRRAWPGLLLFGLLAASRFAQYISRPSPPSDLPTVAGGAADAEATPLEEILTKIEAMPPPVTRPRRRDGPKRAEAPSAELQIRPHPPPLPPDTGRVAPSASDHKSTALQREQLGHVAGGPAATKTTSTHGLDSAGTG